MIVDMDLLGAGDVVAKVLERAGWRAAHRAWLVPRLTYQVHNGHLHTLVALAAEPRPRLEVDLAAADPSTSAVDGVGGIQLDLDVGDRLREVLWVLVDEARRVRLETIDRLLNRLTELCSGVSIVTGHPPAAADPTGAAIDAALRRAGWWPVNRPGLRPRLTYQFHNGHLFTLVTVDMYHPGEHSVNVSWNDVAGRGRLWLGPPQACFYLHPGDRLADTLQVLVRLAAAVTVQTFYEYLHELLDVCPDITTYGPPARVTKQTVFPTLS